MTNENLAKRLKIVKEVKKAALLNLAEVLAEGLTEVVARSALSLPYSSYEVMPSKLQELEMKTSLCSAIYSIANAYEHKLVKKSY